MVKKDWLSVILVGALVLIVGIGLLVKYGMERAVAEEVLVKFPNRGVPRMNITLNGVSLEEINAGSKDVKYEGNWLDLYEGDEKTLEAENVRVKGRGNGTWAQEKKPYQIKFDKKVDLFGLGKAKKWALLANAMDATNLRTAIAFDLEEMLDMNPRFDGEFVELYVDGEYVGLYYLTHVVEIGKSTVDLKDPMGVLVELDNIYGDLEHNYSTKNGELLVVKDFVNVENMPMAMERFVERFNELEIAIEEKNYSKVEEIADMDSFAKYYLLSEFSVNPDAYWTSFFFYKDGYNDKIHAGPGWDFDLAFANRSWGNWMGENYYSPAQSMIRKGELLPREAYEEMGLIGEMDWYEMSLSISHIFYDLMEIPEFQEKVKEVFYKYLQGKASELVTTIKKDEKIISKVAKANSDVWGKEWFESEISDLAEWVRQRFIYFENMYLDSVEEIDYSK